MGDAAEREPAPDELATLVARYADVIRAAVARVAGRTDADLGDEIVQRVTIALWRRDDREQAIANPASYLYRCAVRETIRELRRVVTGDAAPLSALPAAPDGDPEAALRARDVAAATEAAIAAMAPDRALALRAHLFGFSVEEIMAAHGWSYQKARNLIARGTADLRTALRERGYP
jgi:DNA-directed RNA polymerase specialized sigma24 family protein